MWERIRNIFQGQEKQADVTVNSSNQKEGPPKSPYSEFDPDLFTMAYRHFICLLELPVDKENQILADLIGQSELIPGRAEKVFRSHIPVSEKLPWIEDYSFLYNPASGKKITQFKQIALITRLIYRLYSTEQRIGHETRLGLHYGVNNRCAYLEHRPPCSLHKEDNLKVIYVNEYIKDKPLCRDPYCICNLVWEPLSPRSKKRWKEYLKSKVAENI